MLAPLPKLWPDPIFVGVLGVLSGHSVMILSAEGCERSRCGAFSASLVVLNYRKPAPSWKDGGELRWFPFAPTTYPTAGTYETSFLWIGRSLTLFPTRVKSTRATIFDSRLLHLFSLLVAPNK